MSQDTFETMKALTEILLFLFCIARVTLALIRSPGIQCFVPGECLDSQILDARPTNTSRSCLSLCQGLTGCEWFTWYTDSKVCTSLSGCLSLTEEKCGSNCISGEQECPEIQCGIEGRCYGALEGIRKVGSGKECGSICGQRSECTWFSYSNQTNSCTMTNDCPVLDRSCNDCQASETACAIDQENQTHGVQLVAEDKPSDYLFWNDIIIRSFNTKTLEIHSIATSFDKATWIKFVSKIRGKLFVMGTERRSSTNRKPNAYMLTFEIEEHTDKPKEVPLPTIYPKPSKDSQLISLSDGRIWMFDYQNQKTFLFNGETFVPSVQPLWVKGSYGMCMQTIGRVHDDNIVAVGGWRYNLELKERSKTRERSVYVLDMKKNESRQMADLPKDMLRASIWPIVLDGQQKVFIGKGGKAINPIHFVRTKSLLILDWKSGKYTELESDDQYFPIEDNLAFKTIKMLGNLPYAVHSNVSHTKIFNLQDIADGKRTNKPNFIIPGRMP